MAQQELALPQATTNMQVLQGEPEDATECRHIRFLQEKKLATSPPKLHLAFSKAEQPQPLSGRTSASPSSSREERQPCTDSLLFFRWS